MRRLAPIAASCLLWACSDDPAGPVGGDLSDGSGDVDTIADTAPEDGRDGFDTKDTPDTTQPPDTTTCAEDCAALAGPCRDGTCEGGTCQFVPRAGACDDGDLCTRDDRCEAGLCVGTARTCPVPSGVCAGAACEPATGECVVTDSCPVGSSCTDAGCVCDEGYEEGESGCVDLNECEDTPCQVGRTCVNLNGSFACLCPTGTTGADCVPACECPWEVGTCANASARLQVEVVDIWGHAIEGVVSARDALGNALQGSGGARLDVPLCGPVELSVSASAPVHHGGEVRLVWSGAELSVLATPSQDFAWISGREGNNRKVVLGLAHRWFAATGRPARRGNRVELLMNGEEAWRRVHGDMMASTALITGASWWWTSELEIVRDRATGNALSSAARWANTVLGALEGRSQVERKILVNQFVSQDGLFSGLTVDDALEAKGKARNDGFDYLGQANPAGGRFTVTLPPVDLASRLGAPGVAARGDLLPFIGPVAVDTNDLPLGLSLVDLPISSWHQKFWTFDQRVAFVGGMNAKTTDWDTLQHLVFDNLRMDFDATRSERDKVSRREAEPDFGPRKDYMIRVDGPSAIDAVDVFHRRWQRLLTEGVEYAENASDFDVMRAPSPWPDGIQAQVVATMPAPYHENAILETLLRAISQADRFIYIEDQYFRAPILYDAIVHRMTAIPELVLIVVTKPVSEWTDPGCWQTHLANDRFKRLFPGRFRVYQATAYDVVRTDCTFCFDETEAHFVNIDLHSKIVIIDDEYLEIGSCNSNNRGLLYEGELAVAVHDAGLVAAARRRIVNHLLGTPGADQIDPANLIARLDAAAAVNQQAFDRWDDEGMDLDLDGDPIPNGMTPKGFLYPLVFDDPDECLIEDVGPDVT